MLINNEFIAYWIISFLLALLLGPIIIQLIKRLNLYDIPRSSAHKQHQKATPIAGGTILIFTLILTATITGMWQDETIRVIMIGSLIIYLFGIGDDAFGFSAPHKLIGQLLAAGLLIYNGFSVKLFLSLGEIFLPTALIPWVDLALTVLWMVGITNAMNFIDSMDGLAVRLNTIIFLFFLFALIESGQTSLLWLSVTILGITLALNFYNKNPATLFLGDSGAQTLGFLAAAVGMVYIPRDLDPLSTWFVPILVLLVPIFDTTLVVISRIKNKKGIFTGSLDHTYHRLVALGLPQSRAILLIHLVAVLFGGAAFILMRLPPLLANTIFGLILLVLAGLIISSLNVWEE